jgi:hypothetical protein
VASQLLTSGGLSITGFSLRPAETHMGDEGVRHMFADILAMVANDPPALPVRAVLPVAEADAAISLSRGGGRGRVQIDLSV